MVFGFGVTCISITDNKRASRKKSKNQNPNKRQQQEATSRKRDRDDATGLSVAFQAGTPLLEEQRPPHALDLFLWAHIALWVLPDRQEDGLSGAFLFDQTQRAATTTTALRRDAQGRTAEAAAARLSPSASRGRGRGPQRKGEEEEEEEGCPQYQL